MKSNILPISSVLAALAAVALLPVSATAASLAFTAIGILSIFIADYGRSVAPLRAVAPVVPFGAACGELRAAA